MAFVSVSLVSQRWLTLTLLPKRLLQVFSLISLRDFRNRTTRRTTYSSTQTTLSKLHTTALFRYIFNNNSPATQKDNRSDASHETNRQTKKPTNRCGSIRSREFPNIRACFKCTVRSHRKRVRTDGRDWFFFFREQTRERNSEYGFGSFGGFDAVQNSAQEERTASDTLRGPYRAGRRRNCRLEDAQILLVWWYG